jgi:hypothetical protein
MRTLVLPGVSSAFMVRTLTEYAINATAWPRYDGDPGLVCSAGKDAPEIFCSPGKKIGTGGRGART